MMVSDQGFIPKAKWNRLVGLMRANWVRGMVGGRINRDQLGLDIITKPGAGSGTHPLQLFDDSDGATARVKIRYGTVGGEISDEMTIGEEFSGPIVCHASTDLAAGVVQGELTVDGSGIPTGPWAVFCEASLESSTSTLFKFEIGSYVVHVTDGVASVSLVQNLTGSQGYLKCGSSHVTPETSRFF